MTNNLRNLRYVILLDPSMDNIYIIQTIHLCRMGWLSLHSLT